MSDGQVFFRLAFRPFFLLGALFSVIAVLVWSATVTGRLNLEVYGGPLWWHVHEMLFGFVSAIVVGFLLTAVRTWTNQPGIRDAALACLVLLWLSGRFVLFLTQLLPSWVVALVDLSFLPAAAIVLAAPLIRVKQWRNIVFVFVLLAMTCANTAMHWAAYSNDVEFLYRAGNAMVLVVTVLMTIMAGRVLPMFTANGTQTKKVAENTWLERASIISPLAAVAASLSQGFMPVELVAFCFFIAALAHVLRAFRWRFWVTAKVPLLWSLHLSYWCIPTGLLLYGLSFVSSSVTHSQAIHTLTVGAMGMMILAMISRVSLGHTGRPLVVSKVMPLAFLALLGAFLVRVFGVYWIESYTLLIIITAVLWMIGYGCFVAVYLPVLTGPRADGKEG